MVSPGFSFTRSEAVFDRGDIVHPRPGFHIPGLHGFVVLHDINKWTIQTRRDDLGGNNRRLLAGFHKDSGGQELPGPQCFIGVGKRGLELEGAGIHIDFVIDERQFSLCENPAVIGHRLNRQRRAVFRKLSPNRRQTVLWQGENHRNRLELGDYHQPALLTGGHQIPLIDQAHSRPTRDRGLHGGEIQVEFGRFLGSDVGFFLREELGHIRFGLIEDLPALRPRFHQIADALQILAGVAELCGGLGDLGFCLREQRFVGPGVDPRQDVALAHRLTFGETDLIQHAADPRADGDTVVGLDRGKPRNPDRHVPDRDRDGGHGNGFLALPPLGLRGLGTLIGGPMAPCEDDADGKE